MPDLQTTEIHVKPEKSKSPAQSQQLISAPNAGSAQIPEAKHYESPIRGSENLDLTRLVPYDESEIYQKVDQHIRKIQKEFEDLVEEMSGSMNEVFSLLALHLDNQMRGLNEGCAMALEEIRSSERKQGTVGLFGQRFNLTLDMLEEIREQLLSFINMLRTAYSQFFQDD
ncbi:hypothetical protein K493DRAFT_296429 [Basidiobolus meristosporus CBS 931.73]|uniref:Uncharacterized protein n=1 Tax=Basidiobolus meristosporus CBS 931.73 TaxID=1314790 RepID=A0A1Y1Z5W4_9FUNG|nr:hypothetical protein K493DRAFT_296429 [Basidiobolus meristosporus CBS 931.73]|eukprot:ORY05514.1 hypothetical protein K493DRAFT_296429 [Basidiobolus meristosporus CBS 931.73]